MRYADPSRSLAVCDNCGQRWKRSQLRYQVINMIVTRELHCPQCLDLDQPQYQINRLRDIGDPYPVYDPRPDPAIYPQRGGYSWNPVGGIGLTISMYPATQETVAPFIGEYTWPA